VLSNFDARLHALVAAFGLGGAFAVVAPSSEAGAAKPSRGAFEHVRQRLAARPPLAPAECLHVGDSLREDVEGALAAEWRAVWLDRDGAGERTVLPAGAARVASLAELPDLLARAR
jgi:putative hydrolase of the HAD superfamily